MGRRLLTIWGLCAVAGCSSAGAQQVTPAPEKAAVAGGRITDRYPMDGCSGEVEHDTWTLTCPQFVVSRTLVEWDSDWTESLVVNTTLATLREGAETVGETVDRHPAPGLSVDGGRGYAMILRTGAAEAPQTFGMTTFARPMDAGHVVGVVCMDLEQTVTTRCEEISVWFAGNLPALEFVDISRPTQFAGRQLTAPPGCETEGDSTITCATGAELLWFEREADDSPTGHLDELEVVHRAILKVNEERTGSVPEPTRESFDCRLDGEIGECAIFRYEYASGVLYVVVGTGLVREVEVGVLCDWTSELADEIPVPCSLIVDPTLSDVPTKEL